MSTTVAGRTEELESVRQGRNIDGRRSRRRPGSGRIVETIQIAVAVAAEIERKRRQEDDDEPGEDGDHEAVANGDLLDLIIKEGMTDPSEEAAGDENEGQCQNYRIFAAQKADDDRRQKKAAVDHDSGRYGMKNKY